MLLLLVAFIAQSVWSFGDQIGSMSNYVSNYQTELGVWSFLFVISSLLLLIFLRNCPLKSSIEILIKGLFLLVFGFFANYQIFDALIASWSTFTSGELLASVVDISKNSLTICAIIYMLFSLFIAGR